MSLLRKLREIELLECWNCETLPPLGQLPRFQVLKITCMYSLKCIGVEFYGEIGEHLKVFPSLEELELDNMPSLEKWEFLQPSSLLNDDENGNATFPCLRKLGLQSCPNMETPSIFMETSCCLRNLNSLSIGGVSFPIPSFRNYTALETLEIYQNDSILSGEIENLTALKSFKIKECDDLISLPAEGLQKLTSLNLNSITIEDCHSLKTLPAMTVKSSCCSLVFFKIEWCGSLTSVSEGLQYLTSLEILLILFCNNLELKKEDFQHLTSLRHLVLNFLPMVTSIPDVQNLKALQSGDVYGCHPNLHKRFKKDKGVDWPDNISIR